MNYGVILAAGSGSRMGSQLPKQFLEIDSVPILVKSTEHFYHCAEINQIILAVPREYMDYTTDLMQKYFPGNHFHITSGGSDRSKTLQMLVDYIFYHFPVDEKTILVTHDGVRPFITERMITDNIAAALDCGACNTVVPAVDTILSSNDGMFISEVFDRSKIFHAQTPQSFQALKLKKLLDDMSPQMLSRLTDGCSVFTLNNQPVKLVMGSHENVKITFPSDLNG